MPEYLAPGVYVEEVSFRAKSIEGVSTTTTGFIGAMRYGPTDLEPDVITSLTEFERTYGDRGQLTYADGSVMHNFMWHAARAFFEEGGKRLYVVRAFRENPTVVPPGSRGTIKGWATEVRNGDGQVVGYRDSGIAYKEILALGHPADHHRAIRVRARWPGDAGEVRVRFTLQLGQNVLTDRGGETAVGSLLDRDVVYVDRGVVQSPPASSPSPGTGFYVARYEYDDASQKATWNFYDSGVALPRFTLAQLHPSQRDRVHVVTLTVTVFPRNPEELPTVWTGLPLDPEHRRGGERDSFVARFTIDTESASKGRDLPIVVEFGDLIKTGLDLLDTLDQLTMDPGDRANRTVLEALVQPTSTDSERSFEVRLEGGNDGVRPGAAEYVGEAPPDKATKTGLKAFEDIEDISIIAAPGSTWSYANSYNSDARSIVAALISHAERMRYRIAVLDSGDALTIADVRAMRAQYDSTYAALYYPWVRVLDPVTRKEIHLPPSGFVAGIYARNDIQRAVYKAPANEVVRSALGFEVLLNKSQQEVLNPEGINCFRFFEGRGYRLWGARTISSDPEWKYVNLRRYFIYLERSIDKGTQWAVFEPNGEALWANVRRTIEDFLLNEWQNGALLGDKPEKAYFVKCDRSTMGQNDLDNGRLVCLIGVAPLRPAEFVIFRIGQWTADRRS